MPRPIYRLSSLLLLGATVLTSAATIAEAVDYPIAGTRLVVSRSASGKQRLVFVSSDPSIVSPAPAGADDPTSTGVTIELFSGLDGAAPALGVPNAAGAAPAEWKDTGPDYKFVHRGAPATPSEVRVFQIKDGRRLRIVAKEAALPLTGVNGFVAIRISMGDTRYCARFDAADAKKDQAGKFIGRRADSAGLPDCTDAGLGVGATPILPTNTQACPTFQDGTMTVLGNQVLIRMAPDAADNTGPLVFAWHGLGSNPWGAVSHLLGPDGQLQDILDMGGMVVAPFGHGPPFEFGAADFLTADEIVACAVDQVNLDPMQIHSVGFSAGGLTTTLMSQARSNYLASVVAWSGGFQAVDQNPDNKLPALMSHGGATDFVFIAFEPIMEAYYSTIVAEGHFGIICRHNSGHTVPSVLREQTLDFFIDHPFGTMPSPYSGGGLPAVFPGYCATSS